MVLAPSVIIRFASASALLLAWLALAGRSAAQSDWKKDWEQTLAAAKKEGQVTVYIYRYEGLLQDFKREYPGINVVSVTGRGNELTNRIMAERRAGSLSPTFIAAAPTAFITRSTRARRSIRSSRC